MWCVCVCVPVLDSMCVCVCVSWRWFSEPLTETLPNEDFLHLPRSPLIPDKVFNLLAWPGPPSDPGDLCPEDVEGSGRPLPRQPQHDKINSGGSRQMLCQMWANAPDWCYQTDIRHNLHLCGPAADLKLHWAAFLLKSADNLSESITKWQDSEEYFIFKYM